MVVWLYIYLYSWVVLFSWLGLLWVPSLPLFSLSLLCYDNACRLGVNF